MSRFLGSILAGLLLFSSPWLKADQASCDASLDRELRALVQGDHKGILAQQLQLTTIKLALQAKKANTSTVEEYVKKESTRIGELDSHGVRTKLENLYVTNRLPIDSKILAEKIKNANYFKRAARFKNEELSVYVLALQEKDGTDQPFNRMDSAILWYQSQVAAKSTAQAGTREANLLQASTLAGRYMGFMTGVKKWSVSELEAQIGYLKEGLTRSFRALSESLIQKIDPKCKTEMSCFDCSIKPESLEDRLSGWMQGTKRVLEGEPSVSPSPATSPSSVPLTTTPIVTTVPTSILPEVRALTVELEKPIRIIPTKESLGDVGVILKSTEKTTTGPITYIQPTLSSAPKSGDGQDIWLTASKDAFAYAPLKLDLFKKAYRGWKKIKASDSKTGDQVTIIDFDQKTSSPRMYLVNMVTGKLVLQMHTTHATKSDVNPRDGIPETFGNVPESGLTSLGFYRVKDNRHDSPTYGDAVSIEGIDGSLNNNAFTREIKIHGMSNAAYTTTYGCFALSDEVSMSQYGAKYASYTTTSALQYYRDRIQNGDLVFAYSSKGNQDTKSKWLQ